MTCEIDAPTCDLLMVLVSLGVIVYVPSLLGNELTERDFVIFTKVAKLAYVCNDLGRNDL